MSYYFWLQYTAFKRSMTDIGLPPVVGAFLIVLLGYVFYFLTKSYPQYAPIMISYIVLNILYSLSGPNRVDFLKNTYITKQYTVIRFIENQVYSFPFVLISAFQGMWPLVAILVASALAFALVSVKRPGSRKIPTPFPSPAFEMVVFFRRFWFLLAVLGSLAGIAAYYGNANLLLVAMGMTLFSALGAYSIMEDEYFVWNMSATPAGFVRHKICLGGLQMGILAAPFLPLALFLGVSTILWALTCWLSGLLILALAILMKYAVYPRKVGITEAVECMVMMFIPVLWIAAYFYYYKKSIRNLKNYL